MEVLKVGEALNPTEHGALILHKVLDLVPVGIPGLHGLRFRLGPLDLHGTLLMLR